MAERIATANIPPQVLEQIQDLTRKLQIPCAQVRAINELFPTEVANNYLEDDYPIRTATRAWAAKHGFSEARAIIDIARHLNLISKGKEVELIREIGEPTELSNETRTPCQNVPDRPAWDHDQGALSYQGQKVFIRVSKAKNLCRILDLFEQSGWSSGISNPLSASRNSHQLRDAACSLNCKIPFLRSHVIDRGTRIT